MYRFLRDFEKIDIKKINEIEKKIDINIPCLYKNFISNYNNAFFKSRYLFLLRPEKGYKIEDNEKLNNDAFSLRKFLDFKKIENDILIFEKTDLNSKEFIPILKDMGGAFYFLCCNIEENYGKIYFDNEESGYTIETLYCVADSIEEFLDCVVDEETYEEFCKNNSEGTL